MSILFVNDLTVIDCAYLDPTRGVVGESWIVDLELTGGLDDQSMVLDFGLVKKSIKTLIDEKVDHKLLLPMQYIGLQIDHSDNPTLTFQSKRGLIQHQSPADALCPLDGTTITPDIVAAYLEQEIANITPDNVHAVKLHLHTEIIQGEYYHYTHGLKKHDGNCQRIAHGHRSTIEITQHGQRQPKLEKQIATEWQDIYIGSQSDVIEQTNERTAFSYQAPQGTFSISLPTEHCYLMANDSTVECIAEHLAKRLSEEQKITTKVKAFEGVKKGAIAEG